MVICESFVMLHHGLVVYARMCRTVNGTTQMMIARADAGSILGWDDGNEKMNRAFTGGIGRGWIDDPFIQNAARQCFNNQFS